MDPKHPTGTSPDSPPCPAAESPPWSRTVPNIAQVFSLGPTLRVSTTSFEAHLTEEEGAADSRAKALVGILPLQLPVCALSKQTPDPRSHASTSTPINRDDGLASLHPPHTQHRPRRDPPTTPRSLPLVLALALTLEGPPLPAQAVPLTLGAPWPLCQAEDKVPLPTCPNPSAPAQPIPTYAPCLAPSHPHPPLSLKSLCLESSPIHPC